MEVIQLKEISKIYRTSSIETLALDNINLTINKGEFVSIMGPSGCGKSTLLNVMGLLDRPTSGSVFIDGQPTASLSDKALSAMRNAKLGFIFQSFHLIPSLSVAENVELPLIYRKGLSDRKRRELVRAAIEQVELTHRVDHTPSQLSGGQCQRVAIARAIVGDPEIIFADEPTGNLDSNMSAEVMAILHRLNREQGRTIVMVTHNEEQAKSTGRIIRMFDGHQII